MDKRTRNTVSVIVCTLSVGVNLTMALSVEFIYLAAPLARQWIIEQGIIDMRVWLKGAMYSVV